MKILNYRIIQKFYTFYVRVILPGSTRVCVGRIKQKPPTPTFEMKKEKIDHKRQDCFEKYHSIY
jgi:hypothetical protein